MVLVIKKNIIPIWLIYIFALIALFPAIIAVLYYYFKQKDHEFEYQVRDIKHQCQKIMKEKHIQYRDMELSTHINEFIIHDEKRTNQYYMQQIKIQKKTLMMLKNKLKKIDVDDMLIVKGFDGVEIHNDGGSHRINEEITLFTLFQGLNSLNSDVIEEAYEFVYEHARLTDSAREKFDEARARFEGLATHRGVLIAMIKAHNNEYFDKVIKPLMGKKQPIANVTNMLNQRIKPINSSDVLEAQTVQEKINILAEGVRNMVHLDAYLVCIDTFTPRVLSHECFVRLVKAYFSNKEVADVVELLRMNTINTSDVLKFDTIFKILRF